MSMLYLIATLTIVGAERREAPLEELVQQWQAECATSSETGPCLGLAAEIEIGLYDLLRRFQLNRVPIDREVLIGAARSNLPALARLGVSQLGVPRNEEEEDALLDAINHPVLAVRYEAQRNLSNSQSPEYLAVKKWWTGWTLASSANGPEASLIPDLKPDASQFSMSSFNGLEYQYFGSDRERAMFTTSESVESFVNRLRKNRRVLTSTEALQETMDLIQPELDAVQKELEEAGARNDMAALDKAMKKYEMLTQRMNGASTLGANPMIESYTVILKHDVKTKRALCTVMVQRDEDLDRTVLLFWKEGGWRP